MFKILLFVCAAHAPATVECELYPSIESFDSPMQCAEGYKRKYNAYVHQMYEGTDTTVHVKCSTIEEVMKLQVEKEAFEKMPGVKA